STVSKCYSKAQPNKFSVRGSAHSDYSSLSDSQLLFGSQFCLENTQAATAPLELGTQLGPQNSQDMKNDSLSEPSIFTKYQTKPQLFDEDAKERGLLNFGAGKVKSILENFELIYHIPAPCLHLLMCCLFLSAPQKDEEISEVKSSVQRLKEGLESLPAQLSDQHLKLCEQSGLLKLPNTLAELQSLISTGKLPLHVADSASQTSPGLRQGSALGKEDTCCQGRRAWSSPLQPRSPCRAHQKGGCRTSQQLTGDGAWSLNVASGRKVSPAAPTPCGTANASLQEVQSALGTQSCAGSSCACCAGTHVAGRSCKNHRPIPQEESLPTPLRKAVRRATRGFNTLVTQSQQEGQPQVCHLSVQKDMSGHKDRSSSADSSKARQKLGKIPRNKAAGWKKPCPAWRRGELPRCSDNRMKQRMANRILELEGSRKNGFPRYTVTLNSGSSEAVCAAPGERMLGAVPQRPSKNALQGPRSDGDVQQLVNKGKQGLEKQKGANISSTRRNFWDSSPQENLFSLYSTAGDKRVSRLSPPSSNKPRPAASLAQQNMACCSLVFDSDYSD
uniref:Uncharacterized protein n=1 Tax=Nothoprocta perdicaria TaxID=30464 RepID=A0A8C6YZH6_NOTPE